MQTSLRGISDSITLVSEKVSRFEETGAVIPHAGICEGVVG